MYKTQGMVFLKFRYKFVSYLTSLDKNIYINLQIYIAFFTSR